MSEPTRLYAVVDASSGRVLLQFTGFEAAILWVGLRSRASRPLYLVTQSESEASLDAAS